MATKKSNASDAVEIVAIERGQMTMLVRGTTPLVLNRLSEKAKRELLLPRGRKTGAQKQAELKHNPYEEFRASAHILSDEDAPTLLALPSTTFKGAMGTAALDLPGAKKAQIGRLVYVHNEMIGVYGEPQLFMRPVRQADMNRTPDIRTRVIVPRWAALVTISYVRPVLRDTAVVNLLAAAGITAGVGDYRPEKGKGSYGQFEIVGPDDPEANEIMKWGRAAQQAAMDDPTMYDDETAELFEWFAEEADRRGFEVAVSANGHAA